MPDTRAHVGSSDSRPEPEPTRPEPEPPKPKAISEETLGKVERFGYRLGRGIAIVLLIVVVAVPVAWWLVPRS
jgi:hypothetical protein